MQTLTTKEAELITFARQYLAELATPDPSMPYADSRPDYNWFGWETDEELYAAIITKSEEEGYNIGSMENNRAELRSLLNFMYWDQ